MMRKVWTMLLAGAAAFAAGCGADDGGGAAARVIVFQIDPAEVSPGEEATLQWATRDASSIKIRDGEGRAIDLGDASAEAGAVVLTPIASTNYTLEAIGRGGKATAQTELLVGEGPRIVRFELVSSPSGAKEGQVEVRWETRGAEEVRLESPDGFEASVGEAERAKGSMKIPAGPSGMVRLIATRGESTASRELEIPSVGDAAKSFEAEPALITAGERTKVSLRWELAHAADALRLIAEPGGEIELGGGVGERGDVEVEVSETTTFILSALWGERSSSSKVTVVAIEAPTIDRFAAAENSVPKGSEAELNWKTKGATSISIFLAGAEVSTEPLPGSGAVRVPIDAASVFKLVASNEAGASVEAEVEVGTHEGPRWARLLAEPSLVQIGRKVRLKWEVASAGPFQVSISDPEGAPVIVSGADRTLGEVEIVASTGGSHRYTLLVEGEEGAPPVLASATFEAIEAPTAQLMADRSVYDPDKDDGVRLSWETNGATSIVLYVLGEDGLPVHPALYEAAGGESVAAGSYLANPTGAASYRLVARNEVRTEVVKELHVSVVEPTIDWFSVEAGAFVRDRYLAMLNWETSGGKVQLRAGRDRNSLKSLHEAGHAPFIPPPEKGEEVHMKDCPELKDGCGILYFPEGFVFPYDGEEFRAIRIFPEGYMGFDMAEVKDERRPYTIPVMTMPSLNLSPYYVDYFVILREPRRVVWEEREVDGRRALLISNVSVPEPKDIWIDYQVVLFEDGSFDYRYGKVESREDPHGPTGERWVVMVGFQNMGGSVGEELRPAFVPYPGTYQNRTLRYFRAAEGSEVVHLIEDSQVFELCVENRMGTKVCETREVRFR